MEIPTERHEGAEAFLNAIRPSSGRWLKGYEYRNQWIFRGQGNTKWPLVPSLWRDGEERNSNPFWLATEAEAHQITEPSRQDAGALQRERAYEVIHARLTEYAGMRAFAELADTLGFDASRPPALDRQESGKWQSRQFAAWPLRPSEMTALAQHHGIQTRLLDFAHHPLVAAYFAAASAVMRKTDLAVWAINTSLMANQKRVHVLSYPRARNRYLHAQSGVFLYDSDAEDQYYALGSWRCVGSTIAEQCGDTAVVKFELWHYEVPKLLRLLLAEQFSQAHLMPSLDNVAVTVKSIAMAPFMGMFNL